MNESFVRLRNQIEVLLVQAQVNLSSVVSDLCAKAKSAFTLSAPPLQ